MREFSLRETAATGLSGLRLTYASSYAIQAVVHLASQGGKPTTAEEIATAYSIPGKFLSRTLRSLVKGGILASLKGPNGGFRLIDTPSRITLLDIIESVDGPVSAVVPPVGANDSEIHKRLEEIFHQAALKTRELLGELHVKDLMTR
jgi:Rrf2 family protein